MSLSGVVVEIDDKHVRIESEGKVRRGTRKGLNPGYEPKIGDVVEFDYEGGQAKNVRPAGTAVAARPATAAAVIETSTYRSPTARSFRNPKNFVPTPTRQVSGPLGDGPRWHDRWHDECFTGTLTLHAQVLTPLLILDATRAHQSGDHRVLDVRVHGDGALIPATTLKGAIRSMVEAATNSRMAIFTRRKQLGSRQRADGTQLVPARIEADGAGNLVVRLLPGNRRIGSGGSLQHAAWLTWSPAIERRHGSPASATLTLWEKQNRFEVFRASSVRCGGEVVLDSPGRVNTLSEKGSKLEGVDGWICAVGKIAPKKHDERFFFDTDSTRVAPTPLTDELRRQWESLLADYRRANERAVRRNIGSPGGEWGRHVRDASQGTLCEGMLLYAEVEQREGTWVPVGLYPVQLSRRLDARSPFELLRADLRPAMRVDELSAADRMFGWVAQADKHSRVDLAAVRGRVAIDDAYLPPPHRLPKPIPLAILSGPKPEQARFYLGVERPDGVSLPFADGEDAKSTRYDDRRIELRVGDRARPSQKSLRGRAIYPRHSTLVEAEYRRAGDQRDDQNISVSGWIEAGTQFTFTVRVDDLSAEELGALVWVLDNAADNRSFSLGFGKPLGFGAVQTRIVGVSIRSTSELVQHLMSWGQAGSITGDSAVDSCREAFKRATAMSLGYEPERFEEVPHIAAIVAATGDPTGRLPIRYPRASDRIDPEGKNYEWFTRNERTGRGVEQRQFSLPDLANDIGLPYING